MTPLLDAILSRELDRAAEIVHERCVEDGAEEVRDEILRFSVLAFAPSLHSRATMYAALAVADLFESLSNRSLLLIEAARYAGESHVPWGKSPITDPPRLEQGYEPDPQRLDDAMSGGDIREGERWLAAVIERSDATAFFDAASRNAGPEGFGFCTAAVGWRIADRFPPFVRFAVLRTSLREWIQSPGSPAEEDGSSFGENLVKVVSDYVGTGGALGFQHLVVADAILTAERVVRSKGRYAGLLSRYADRETQPRESRGRLFWSESDLAYRYATDYAIFLQSVPLSSRLESAAGKATCEKIPETAFYDLKNTDGFECWSFA